MAQITEQHFDGLKLQLQRKRNKFTQEQFAHSLGVSRQSVCNWECGVSEPNVNKLLEISSLLGTEISAFLT